MARRNKQVYNRQFDEAKYKKVNQFNKDLLDDWCFELKVQGKPESTIYQYKRNVMLFYIWILDNLDNKPVWQLKKKQFRNYILHLQSLDLSPARILTIKSSISSMLTYAEDDDEYEEIEVNYMSKIKGMKKTTSRETVFLTDEHISILYNKLKSAKKYQELLLLALLYDTGARKNEIYQLERDYIDVNANVTTEKVTGKRGKKFYLYYHDRTIEAYNLYMSIRSDDCEILWMEKPGVKMSIEKLYAVVKRWNKILEVETGEYLDFNVHSFRHCFAENMENGTHYVARELGVELSLNEIQVILNHESVETTQSYVKKKDQEIVFRAFRWNKNKKDEDKEEKDNKDKEIEEE